MQCSAISGIKQKFILIAERVPAYETVWIIGDDFVSNTVGEFLQVDDSSSKPYLSENYDVKMICSNSLLLNHSVSARIHNNLINAIEEQALPFILDADLIKTIHFKEHGASVITEILEMVLKNLMVGIPRTILTHKENLPQCSKKVRYPMILWALAPQHEFFPGKWNIDRRQFNASVEKGVQSFQEMNTLKLLKFWDPEDNSLFVDHRITVQGLAAIWASIDSAFRHWDTFIATKSRKMANKRENPSQQKGGNAHHPREFIKNEFRKYKNHKTSDKFCWQKKEERRPLPQPPPHDQF